MKIRFLRLIGVDTWYGKSMDEARDYVNSLKSEEAALYTVRPDGAWAGTSIIYRVDQKDCPDFWQDKAKSIYLRWWELEEFLTGFAIVELHPNKLSDLIEMKRFHCEEQLDGIFDAAFPSWTGEHVKVSKFHPPKFISILYIEPEQALSVNLKDSRDNGFPAGISEILSMVGQEKSVCQPHLLVDILLLFGIGLSGPEKQAMAISVKPLAQRLDEGDLMLPKTVMELGWYMTYISMFNYLSGRMKKLRFYRHDIDEYIEKLNFKRNLGRNYELKFLKDREEGLSERLRTTKLAKKILKAAKNNYVSLLRGWKESLTVETGITGTAGYAYRYDFLDALAGALSKEEEYFDEVSELVFNREMVLSDYLRDKAIAESTRSNLSLQKSIRWLTFFAAIIAILALFISLLTKAH